MDGYLELSDGRVIDVVDDLTIGRVKSCGIPIDDPKASRRHARLIVDRGVVEIEDLDSSNGTLLNGKPVTRRLLRPGDVIQVGKTEFTYREGAASPAARPASEPEPASAPEPVRAPVDPAPPAPAPAAPVHNEDLLASDLLDDDFVDAPIAPPIAPPQATPPPPSPPSRPPAAAPPRKPAPPPRPEPAAPRPAAPPRAAASNPGRAEPSSQPAAARSEHGVLQFSKRAGGGALHDDIGQTGGLQRLVIIIVAVLFAAVVGFFAMQFARG